MTGTGFFWIILACALFGALHSWLASSSLKAAVARRVGQPAYNRYYRLFFAVMGTVTTLPLLVLAAWLPDRPIYTFPAPWRYLAWLIQAAAAVMMLYAVSQTGALRFIGVRQIFDHGSPHAAPEKLVRDGLYRWVRHPIYTALFIFLWLTPVMTWNTLALNLGLTAYMLVGSIFEEQKLVSQFGKEYEDYRRRTPRLFPRLRVSTAPVSQDK
jgi:protein-S-isoprenylcysteine O-methyltransferase Ste14